jgi:hypothetical protein
MILISHRGNLFGKIEEKENSPNYIDEAIIRGFNVEIDLWVKENNLYLGHDLPQYKIDQRWLDVRKNNILVHAKNIFALEILIESKIKFFFHENERHVLIHNSNNVWSHDVSECLPRSIIPALTKNEFLEHCNKNVYGICSDFISISL